MLVRNEASRIGTPFDTSSAVFQSNLRSTREIYAVMLGGGSFQELANFRIAPVGIAARGSLGAHGYNKGKHDESEYVSIPNTGGIHRDDDVSARRNG